MPPTKGIIRFRTKGKLIPRYVVPCPVVALLGKLSYQLNLPPLMHGVHSVFHFFLCFGSILKTPNISFFPNQSPWSTAPKAQLCEGLSTSQSEREATWELECQMHGKYPELFSSGTFEPSNSFRCVICVV